MSHDNLGVEVRGLIQAVLKQQGSADDPLLDNLQDDTELLELGFSSIQLVSLIALLDARYKNLQLQRASGVPPPKTVGEVVSLCRLLAPASTQ